ncbi:FhaA domain-containing protein [Nocardioides sp.]|uniref:FhaA domain-containing protein n=1 Tax=Nocardioides sp. TaxID=35761 RepID=UPI003565E932
MGGLQKFEQRLENIISGAFARAFRSAVQPVEIAAALQRECDNNAQILSRQRRIVPNDFHVELSPSDLERLAPFDTALADELTHQLQDHAESQGYVFPGPIAIGFESATDLVTGRFRIRSRAQARVQSNATHTQVRRARAVLEINGTKHPLTPPGLVVGRGSEADIRINDPGVSRRHVEFQVTSHTNAAGTGELRITARDLGSTNGILIDNHKVSSAGVRDGSEVKIGNTTMIVRVGEDVDDGLGQGSGGWADV